MIDQANTYKQKYEICHRELGVLRQQLKELESQRTGLQASLDMDRSNLKEAETAMRALQKMKMEELRVPEAQAAQAQNVQELLGQLKGIAERITSLNDQARSTLAADQKAAGQRAQTLAKMAQVSPDLAKEVQAMETEREMQMDYMVSVQGQVSASLLRALKWSKGTSEAFFVIPVCRDSIV